MAVCRSSVDLPPIFGPVTKSSDWSFEGSMNVLLGTKGFFEFSDAF